jgi:alpha-1,2-mannosyltransferase
MGDKPEAQLVGHASLRLRLERVACRLARALRPPSFWVVAYFCAFAALPPTFFWLGLYGGRHPDSMLFYSAAQLALGDQVTAIFDPDRMTDALNGLFFPGDSVDKYRLAPWLYPPIFLLVVVPFGLLPFGWFYGVFQAATAAAAAMAVGGRRGRVGWLGFAALMAAPATAINLVVGQNALLSIALLVGGFRLLTSYPWAAGALLGAFVYKPQLCLLVPVALLAARAWRALAATAVSALFLSAVSAAAFGLDAWTSWAAELLHPAGDFAERWIKDSVMLGFGVYTSAVRLGASPMLAVGAQLCAAAIGVTATYRAFRASAPWELRLAVLLCATALTTPHIAPYDLALVACAVVLMFASSLSAGFMAGEAIVMALAWVAPIIRPVDGMPGRFAPLIIAALGSYAMVKILSPARASAPSAR